MYRCNSINILQSICVCVYVWERERERERIIKTDVPPIVNNVDD